MQIKFHKYQGTGNDFILIDNRQNNIELNIRTSMKLLHQLYGRYGNWGLVCGCYNTGRPIVNDYARYCASNYNFKNKWVTIN